MNTLDLSNMPESKENCLLDTLILTYTVLIGILAGKSHLYLSQKEKAEC